MEELKAAISKANAKYYPSRQRLTLPPEPGQRSGNPLLDGKALSDYNLTGGSTVIFKDLGTQASNRLSTISTADICQQLPTLKRAAGWLDNSVFLGILWSLSCVSIVLLLATAIVSWNQVRPADKFA